MAAIRRGLDDVLPSQVLCLFTWQELEERVCGSRDIDIEMLKRHTEYAGIDPHAPFVEYFWRALESFSPAQRRSFVKFAYGQEHLPSSDAEFDTFPRIRMMLKASRARGDPDHTLPHADTCFFNVELPAYSSEAKMRERLLTVVSVEWGMSGDDPEGESVASIPSSVSQSPRRQPAQAPPQPPPPPPVAGAAPSTASLRANTASDRPTRTAAIASTTTRTTASTSAGSSTSTSIRSPSRSRADSSSTPSRSHEGALSSSAVRQVFADFLRRDADGAEELVEMPGLVADSGDSEDGSDLEAAGRYLEDDRWYDDEEDAF